MQRLARHFTASLPTRSIHKLQSDRYLEQSEEAVMKESKVKGTQWVFL
jgi:hypothetical protein